MEKHYSVGIHRKGELKIQDLLDEIRRNPDLGRAGAIALFIGIVREEGHDGGRVNKIRIESYEEVAVNSLRRIAEDLLQEPEIVDVRIHHFVGDMSVGDDIVYIAVAGSHRQAVFKALREAVDRVKKEAAIWKKEITDLGEQWISGG